MLTFQTALALLTQELCSAGKEKVGNGHNLKNEELAPFHQEPKYHGPT